MKPLNPRTRQRRFTLYLVTITFALIAILIKFLVG